MPLARCQMARTCSLELLPLLVGVVLVRGGVVERNRGGVNARARFRTGVMDRIRPRLEVPFWACLGDRSDPLASAEAGFAEG
mmetsp:Transcript_66086/g.91927  ORF Transcript_66086/g.91927 Transcript_66086/m.91927 type:complete len:82 (+) Transcript_66086:2-247(+)